MTGAQFDGRGEVDIDLLADYIGGALSGTPDESVVAALIADDPAWADAYHELADGMAAVGTELTRLGPEPMPADLAARLDALLAGDLATATPAGLASPGSDGAATSAGDAGRGRHLAAVRVPDPAGAGRPGVPNEETQRERGNRPGRARRLRWATPIAIAAGLVAFVGFGLDYLAGRDHAEKADSAGIVQTDARGGAGSFAAPAARPRLFNSGIDYTTATLAAPPEVQPLAATGTDRSTMVPKQAPASDGSGGTDPLSRLRDPAQLRTCLDAIQQDNAGGPIAVQSVDYARFTGKPAVVVRFSAANGIWAWASGPACGTTSGGADTLGSVPVR